MIETPAVYLIVAVAAVWTAWRLFPRGWTKRCASERFTAGRQRDCTCDRGWLEAAGR